VVAALKTRLPWWSKIAAKLVLSRLPFDYAFWKQLALFEHGAMNDPTYALQVFEQHYEQAQVPAGFVGLELGPGDSLLSAAIAAARGSAKCYLVDAGEFATRDIAPYQTATDLLRSQGMDAPDCSTATTLEDVLTLCRAEYLCEGLTSLRQIPTATVDWIWSQAVLEHVRHGEFADTMAQLRRILRPDGVCTHVVDLRDHLGGGLNNLRFSTRQWEAEWMASSGFYTNRMRFSSMLEQFRAADFEPELVRVERWSELPTPRSQLAAEFADLPDEELCVAEFFVVLRPVASAGAGDR